MRSWIYKIAQALGLLLLILGLGSLLALGGHRFWTGSPVTIFTNSADAAGVPGSPCSSYAQCLERQRAAEAAALHGISAGLQRGVAAPAAASEASGSEDETKPAEAQTEEARSASSAGPDAQAAGQTATD